MGGDTSISPHSLLSSFTPASRLSALKPILIYCPFDTPRLRYVLEWIFGSVFKVSYVLTQKEEDLNGYQGPAVNYSHRPLKANLQIVPMGLLEERGISAQEPEMKTWQNLPVFYHSGAGDIPFDLFSAAFYLLSRYEEYQPYEPDAFMRFPHTQSLAWKGGFLHRPLVDEWLMALRKALGPEVLHVPQFRFVPTYDIDIAYSYRGKGWWRNLGGLCSDLLRARTGRVRERLSVLTGKQMDPYDAYAWLDELHRRHNLDPLYFFLLGTKRTALDKSLPPEGKAMQTLIEELSARYRVGLHPSFRSHDNEEILREEMGFLPGVTRSRQHYIRFTLPETYRQLERIGILEDYSMGYGSINGFRASSSYPFPWYDLEEERVGALILHPFCYMECNSFFEQNLSSAEAAAEMNDLLHRVRAVGGQMITVWHNFSVGTEPMWAGWKEVYEDFAGKASG